MRILSFLLFAQMFVLLTLAPVASAADTLNMGICDFSTLGITGNATSNTGTALETEAFTKNSAMETAYSTLYKQGGGESTPVACGETNSSTGMIEKGDCTSSLITEISEVVTDASPSVAGNTEDRIIPVYHGVCCLLYNGQTCYETRDYYTADFASCQTIAGGVSVNCQYRQWIIASTGMGLLKIYVKQIFTFGAFAVGAIAVATIILNGVRISVAGVSGDISEAKQKITQSLSGIVLLFMAALILYSINPDFFGG